MQQKEIPVTYVLYPDEGHGFARPESNLSFFGVTEAFLARHLGPLNTAIIVLTLPPPTAGIGLLAANIPKWVADGGCKKNSVSCML